MDLSYLILSLIIPDVRAFEKFQYRNNNLQLQCTIVVDLFERIGEIVLIYLSESLYTCAE